VSVNPSSRSGEGFVASTITPMQPAVLRLGHADVMWTNASQGGLGHNPPRLEHDESCCGEEITKRRDAIRPGPWIHVTQVHGADVAVAVESTRGGEHEADAVVTAVPGCTLAISTADCAPIALSCAEGVVAAVHGGWRSLQAGVIGRTAAIMRRMGATDIVAALGPCLHVECYEFGDEDIRPLVSLWGEGIRGLTSSGATAFDLPAAVAAACKASDIELTSSDPTCTSCADGYFSHRKRRDTQRQVMLVTMHR
jgi:polyphenol oxidase